MREKHKIMKKYWRHLDTSGQFLIAQSYLLGLRDARTIAVRLLSTP